MTYIRFRSALKYQNALSLRPYKTLGQPYTTWFVLIFLIILTLTNGFNVFFPGEFSASTFLAAYVTLPIVLALYFGHKVWYRTPWVRKIRDVDLWTGKQLADDEEASYPERLPKNGFEKVWFWLA